MKPSETLLEKAGQKETMDTKKENSHFSGISGPTTKVPQYLVL